MHKKLSKKWQTSFVFAIFFVIGIFYTYPLIRHFCHAIPYTRFPAPGQEIQYMRMGDHLSLYYNFWLLKDNLVHFRNPFSDPYQFYYWGKKFFNPQIGFFSVLFTLFSPLGNIPAFNLIFILTFLFAGGATFLWLKKIGFSNFSSLIGGLIYCTAPPRLAQLGSLHIMGYLYFSFPLLLYLSESMVISSRKTYPILLGITILIMAWSEYHMFYYTMLFFIPFGLFCLLRFNDNKDKEIICYNVKIKLLLEGMGVGILIATLAFQRNWPYGKFYFNLFPIIAIGYYLFMKSIILIIDMISLDITLTNEIVSCLLPLVLFVFLPLKIWVSIPYFGHILVLVVLLTIVFKIFTCKMYGFKNSKINHDIIKKLISRFLPILPFAIFCASFIYFIKKLVFGGSIAGKGRSIAEIKCFSPHLINLVQRLNPDGESMVYLGFVSLLLMIPGLYILLIQNKYNEKTDYLRSQSRFWYGTFLCSTFLSLGLTVPFVPLYPFLCKVIPFFKYPRVPGRMIFISYAAIAFCVAWTTEHIDCKKKWVKNGILLAIMVGILIDYYPPRPLGLCLLNQGKTVYGHLEKRDMPPATVLELPIWPGDTAWSAIYQYYVTRYRYPMVNGYSPAVSTDYVKNVFYKLYPLDVATLPKASHEMLKQLHVKYITFHANAYPFKISPFPSWFILRRLKALRGLEEVCHTPYITLFKTTGKCNKTPHADPIGSITSSVGVLWEAERCRRFIGKIVVDPSASGNKAVATIGYQRGLIMGLQYRLFPPGFYDAIIRLKKCGESVRKGPIGVIRIDGFHQKIPLYSKKILSNDLEDNYFNDIKFSFYLPSAKRIGCAVYSYGIAPLSVDYAFLSFHNRGEGPSVFQAEDLFHQAQITRLPGKSKGYGVCFTPEILNDRSVHGPLHRLCQGTYRITFWMGISGDTNPQLQIADIQVTRGMPREILAQKRLYVKNWRHKNTMEPFALVIKLDRPSIVEFPVYYRGIGTLWIDRIDVENIREP